MNTLFNVWLLRTFRLQTSPFTSWLTSGQADKKSLIVLCLGAYGKAQTMQIPGLYVETLIWSPPPKFNKNNSCPSLHWIHSRPDWVSFMLSSERPIVWVINLFVPAWCVYYVINVDIQTNFRWLEVDSTITGHHKTVTWICVNKRWTSVKEQMKEKWNL